MELTYLQATANSEQAPASDNIATPFSQQIVVLTKPDYIQLDWNAKYWRKQHERQVEREVALKAQVAALEATVRDLKQRLYGTKSEKSAGPERVGELKPAKTRNRGQQPGSPGHGRSDRSALPMVTEVHDLSEAAKYCPACGEAFAPFPGAEESTLIEIEVQAHRRRIQRLRYHKRCECPEVAGIP